MIRITPTEARVIAAALNALAAELERAGRPTPHDLAALVGKFRAVRSGHFCLTVGDVADDDRVRSLGTIDDVITMTQLSERTIRRAVESGELPVYRFGRRVRFDLAVDVPAWVEGHRHDEAAA